VRLYFLIFVVILAGDQLSKFIIVAHLPLYDVREVIPGLFNLVHVTNKGAAFSLFATIDSPLRHYFFVAVNSLAVFGLTAVAWKIGGEFRRLYRISFALIAAGALGNLIDRLRHGAVTDFLDFYLGSYHWPAFNVADSAICVGVGVMVLANVLEIRNEKRRRK
jgi:signal peptidase II